MAGYSEDREINLEIKYLRKVLGGVEPPLPASLRGRELLGFIEDVPVPKTKAELILPKKWLNWRSGLTYAAAFLLIVGLSYGLGHRREDIVNGEITLTPGQSEARILPGQEGGEPRITQVDGSPFVEQPQDGAAGGGMEGAEAPGQNMEDNPEVGGEALAVGGNQTIRLGELGEYVLACRSNEGNPDRMADAPYALELLDADSDVIVSRVDIPGMTEIAHCFAEETTVILVGALDGVTAIFPVDYSDPGSPVTQPLIEQAGSLVDARIHDGILHVLTYSADRALGEVASTELPGSVEEGACVITAFDLQERKWAQQAYLGAGMGSKLYRLNAYIYFNQQSDDGQYPELRFAKIRLNGLRIELEDIT